MNSGGATGDALGRGHERLGRNIGRFAANAELIAEHERHARAEGEEQCERDPDEHRSPGLRHHAEQRSKTGTIVPLERRNP